MGKGVYTMENKDANTDRLKSVTVGDQNWEIAEFTIGIFFFAWDLYSLLFFIKGVFKSHLKKAPPPSQFPSKTLIWPKSLTKKLTDF